MKKIVFVFIINIALLANVIYSVKEIKLKNLTQLSKKIALEEIGLKNHQIDENHINQAIKKLYNYGYFKNIKVYYENQNLIFEFFEKPIIANIQITGYKTREDDLKEV